MEQEDKWTVEPYEWGEIGRLKDQYRDINIDTSEETQIKHFEGGLWPFGQFVKEGSLAKTEDLEFKYWSFKAGERSHEPKVQCCAKEYNFIIEGEIRGRVGNTRDIILQAGDYIIIKPGIIINLQQEVRKDVRGITIKTPSRAGDTIKKSYFNDF